MDTAIIDATKGAQTRRAILHAAIERFGRDGFRTATVADIARDASVGGTVTYTYFSNKEALFLAALDEDASGVIHKTLEGLDTGDRSLIGQTDPLAWRDTIVYTLVTALECHPLARRVLAGREPDVTDRIIHIPAMEDLRVGVAARIHSDQKAGLVRQDIDPASIARGSVAIIISLAMAVLQLGAAGALAFGDDVQAVFDAAMLPPASAPGR